MVLRFLSICICVIFVQPNYCHVPFDETVRNTDIAEVLIAYDVHQNSNKLAFNYNRTSLILIIEKLLKNTKLPLGKDKVRVGVVELTAEHCRTVIPLQDRFDELSVLVPLLNYSYNNNNKNNNEDTRNLKSYGESMSPKIALRRCYEAENGVRDFAPKLLVYVTQRPNETSEQCIYGNWIEQYRLECLKRVDNGANVAVILSNFGVYPTNGCPNEHYLACGKPFDNETILIRSGTRTQDRLDAHISAIATEIDKILLQILSGSQSRPAMRYYLNYRKKRAQRKSKQARKLKLSPTPEPGIIYDSEEAITTEISEDAEEPKREISDMFRATVALTAACVAIVSVCAYFLACCVYEVDKIRPLSKETFLVCVPISSHSSQPILTRSVQRQLLNRQTKSDSGSGSGTGSGEYDQC